MTERICHCCDGRGVVPAITGEERPCSRCRCEEFSAWARRRRTQDEQEKECPTSRRA